MTYLPALPGQRIKEYPHVSENEARVIWLAAKSLRIEVFIKVLWFTGLRISEVLRLRVMDFRAEGMNFTLVVIRSKKRKAEPERLPIPAELGEALSTYIKTEVFKPTSLLFPGHENTYRYQIRMCARKAALENWQKVHPHSFRHGRVYDLANKGAHPYALSKLMGHSSLGITMQYYQPTEADLRELVERK